MKNTKSWKTTELKTSLQWVPHKNLQKWHKCQHWDCPCFFIFPNFLFVVANHFIAAPAWDTNPDTVSSLLANETVQNKSVKIHPHGAENKSQTLLPTGIAVTMGQKSLLPQKFEVSEHIFLHWRRMALVKMYNSMFKKWRAQEELQHFSVPPCLITPR